jgi:hypothetical protein
MELTMFLAAANEPHQVGNFIGLLAAVAVAALVYHGHQRWLRLKDDGDPSPAGDRAAIESAEPQVKAPSATGGGVGGVAAGGGVAGGAKPKTLRRLKRAFGGGS